MTRLACLTVSVSLLFTPLSFAKLFRTASGYTTGQLPVSAVVQDFNNDHIADIATANENSANVSVLLGNANGTFGAANTFSVGAGAVAVASADFNGDGNNDLVVTDGLSSASISLGNGDGTFAPARSITLRTGTGGIVIADFNGDGKPDIAIAIFGPENNSQGSVAVLLGNGDGTFAAPVFYSLNHNAVRLVAADLNGDGKLDLAVALQHFSSPKNGLAVLLGNGDGTFQAATTSASGDQSDIAAADFNGDGKTDLVLSPVYSTVAQVLLGNGDGTFAPAVQIDAGSSGSLVATDLNGDGKPDLLVGGTHTATLFGNGDGTFGPPTVYAIGQNFAVPGFFNQDAVPDVVAGQYSGIAVALGNRDGTFRAGKSYPGGYIADTVAAADFNQDGKRDLAVGGSTTFPYIYLLLGDGSGDFAEAPGFGAKPAKIMLTADFNRDGLPDLLSTSYDGGTFEVYLAAGDGTFSAATETKVAGGELSPVVGDFNNDGIPDAAIARFLNGATTIFLGNGDGTFTNVGDLAEKHPQSPVVADFNGDGNADLGVEDTVDGIFEVFLGNGDGTFQSPIATAVPKVIYTAAADLNGDGKIDLVVGAMGTQFLPGNGDGTFQPPQTLPSSDAGPIQIADIDGDGNLDIATTSESSSIEVLRGDGHGNFHGPLSFLTGSEGVGLFILSDLNGDGLPDIASPNISDAVNVILNTNRRR